MQPGSVHCQFRVILFHFTRFNICVAALQAGLYSRYLDVKKMEEAALRFSSIFTRWGLFRVGLGSAAERALLNAHALWFQSLTLPTLSYFHGGSFTKALQKAFENTQIEDLWIPYFCITTNMTKMDMGVHQKVFAQMNALVNTSDDARSLN